MTNNQQQNINGLGAFFQTDSQVRMTGAANQLQKTAQLTQMATNIADGILMQIATDPDTYREQLLASQKDHDAMDELISECAGDLSLVDLHFLQSEDEEVLDKMIRSQQSKRSRAKSKVMTQENYKTMMIGAVSELLLRIAANKPKSSGGGAVMGDIGFSEEDLINFAQFPDELKKEIRNVQSKKSIMKSKADFDENHPRWQQLLQAEAQLKAIRDNGASAVSQEAKQALEVKKDLEALLNAETEDMDAEQAKDMLAQIKEMLASKSN